MCICAYAQYLDVTLLSNAMLCYAMLRYVILYHIWCSHKRRCSESWRYCAILFYAMLYCYIRSNRVWCSDKSRRMNLGLPELMRIPFHCVCVSVLFSQWCTCATLSYVILGPTEYGVVTSVGREDLEVITGSGATQRVKPEVHRIYSQA